MFLVDDELALESGARILGSVPDVFVNADGYKKSISGPGIGNYVTVAKAMASARTLLGEEGLRTQTYMQAHGTGTPMGDPIEIAALNDAFGRASGPATIAIGSVKPNIGHLDTAAGVAGFIKLVQAIRHRQLPPSINYEAPNPAVDFVGGLFFVND